jgi:transposase-like protein
MRTSRFSPEQIIRALREAEAALQVTDLRRQVNVAEATFDRWKKQFGEIGVAEQLLTDPAAVAETAEERRKHLRTALMDACLGGQVCGRGAPLWLTSTGSWPTLARVLRRLNSERNITCSVRGAGTTIGLVRSSVLNAEPRWPTVVHTARRRWRRRQRSVANAV